MRTILNIKWYILGLIASLMLTSCLSDSDSFVQGSNTGYVTTKDGIQYLAFPFGHFSATGVQNLQRGRYYLIDYKIEDLNPATNVYPGQILNIYKNKPLEESYLRTEKGEMETVAVKTIWPMDRTNTQFMADGWTFYYLPQEGTKNILNPYFYYDIENQIDKDGKDVSTEKNKVIIDVKFADSNSGLEASDLDKLQIVVAKFGDLRNRYEADFSDSKPVEGASKTADIAIQFRYDRQERDKTDIQYVGSWNIKDATNYFYMTFSEEE